MKIETAYIWLDEIKYDIIEDSGMDEKIEAIETVQRLIRGKITRIVEGEVC